MASFPLVTSIFRIVGDRFPLPERSWKLHCRKSGWNFFADIRLLLTVDPHVIHVTFSRSKMFLTVFISPWTSLQSFPSSLALQPRTSYPSFMQLSQKTFSFARPILTLFLICSHGYPHTVWFRGWFATMALISFLTLYGSRSNHVPAHIVFFFCIHRRHDCGIF